MSSKICSRCIYDDSVSMIYFDDKGICNYCHQIEELKTIYGTGEEKGKKIFLEIVNKIKTHGKNKKYDIIVGVSGGVDSSYMLYLAKKYGLRPLAVHYDNTWNTSIATQNIKKITSTLNIDLLTHVVNNKEIDDIYIAFLKAGVSEIDASTDLGLAETLYRAAKKYNIKYIFEGHSFMEEGITPLGKNYFDGRYIKSIHKKYGSLPMKTYPLMTLTRFLYWTIFKRIKKIRPFWYLNYNKEDAKKMLKQKFDWEDYGGHHLENRMAAFCHSVYWPKKFKVDYRNNNLSAMVRNGKINREEALSIYKSEPPLEHNLLKYFKERLNLSDAQFDHIMKQPLKYWNQFPTYKRYFEFLKPVFYLLAKSNLVPYSFYLKYCFKSQKK